MKLQLRYHFDAAHRLDSYKGKCSNLHGHRWEVLVEIEGKPNKSGMLVDFGNLKKAIDLFDHKTILYRSEENAELVDVLNKMYKKGICQDKPLLVNYIPTAENIIEDIKFQIEENLEVKVIKIVLWESPNASVEI